MWCPLSVNGSFGALTPTVRTWLSHSPVLTPKAMVAANSPGASSPGGTIDTVAGDDGGEVTQGGTGEDGGVQCFVAEDEDCCGSSNPTVVKHSLPFKAATTAMAKRLEGAAVPEPPLEYLSQRHRVIFLPPPLSI